MKDRNPLKSSASQIQEAGNIILQSTISNLRYSLRDTEWFVRSEEDQKDIGIDFEVELVSKTDKEAKRMFKIQNKGTETALIPLKTTKNKGKISFTLSIRHAHYFRYEMQLGVVFTVCDLENRAVYWHPVQLDDNIDSRVAAVKNMNQKSIKIYINPENVLNEQTVQKFLTDIHQSYKSQTLRYIAYFEKQSSITEKIGLSIDKSKPLLNQLHEYLNTKYSEIEYWPIRILIDSYPFKISDSHYQYYSSFHLNVSNDKLPEVLNSEETETADKFSENNELLKYCRKKLYANLIWSISSDKNRNRTSIHYEDEDNCNCITCCLLKFDFKTVKSLIGNRKPKDHSEISKLMYVEYQLGNFLRVYDLLEEINTKAEDQSHSIRKFIAQYNLSKLGFLIRWKYWDNSQDSLVQKLKSINLDVLYTRGSNDSNSRLFEYLASESFISNAQRDISKLKNQIVDHYHSQLRGGWSSNNHVIEMIGHFAQLVHFIRLNYILYDCFDDFLNITDNFIEGLLASHAISPAQKSRLSQFNNWLLTIIIYYGKPENIQKYINRYYIKEIIYSEQENENLIEVFTQNFFENYASFKSVIVGHGQDNNRNILDLYNRWFSNALVIFSYIKLSKKQTNLCATRLLTYIKNEESIQISNYKYVKLFLRRKGHQINKSTLKNYLLLTLSNNKLHDEATFEVITSKIANNHGSIVVSKKDFTGFVNLVTQKCNQCGHPHSSEFLLYLYAILDNQDQCSAIRKVIEELLQKRYNPDTFYLSTLLDVLPLNKDYLNQFISAAASDIGKPTFRSVFSGEKDDRHPQLNMLINLCFKCNINLKQKRFEVFSGINPYYDWLLNMRDFNYEDFDPKWICEYSTRFYRSQIKKHKIIEEKVSQHLQYNRDPELERDFIEIFSKKNI